MKKLISLCMTFLLVLTLVPMQARATEVASGTCGRNVTWVLDSHSNLIISGTGGTDNYYPPMQSPVPALECTRIIINHGVTDIGSNLIMGCYYLTSVSIPDSVTRIGDSAFPACDSLTDVYYSGTQAQWESISISPSNVDLLNATIHFNSSDDYWKTNNSGIASGRLSKTMSWRLDTNGKLTISGTGEMRNFYNSTYAPWYDYKKEIKGVQIDNGVTTIGNNAFSGYSFQHITLPDSITVIGEFAFSSSSLTSIELSSRITTIGQMAFYGSALDSISLPASIENIGWGAFGSCLSLKTVYFEGSAPSIDDYAFVTMEGEYRPEGYPRTTATVYYPANDITWTSSVLQGYGGKLTWLPYEFTRLAGDTRFETAFEIANQFKENLGVERFDSVIVASGTNFADALSGSYLAAVKNAPILLTCNKDFNPRLVEKYNNMLVEYIGANMVPGGTVYILGGEKAVDPSLDEALTGYRVVRLAGATRYETNLEILKEAGVGKREVLICYGEKFPDSLAASATGNPILLVRNKLTDAQKYFLNTTSGEFVIIGGTAVISNDLENSLKNYGSTERLAGSNRYTTCVMVAERFFDQPSAAVVAYGENFPDGLCGGILAHSMDAPLILVREDYLKAATEYTAKNAICSGVVLGGEKLISAASVDKIFGN